MSRERSTLVPGLYYGASRPTQTDVVGVCDTLSARRITAFGWIPRAKPVYDESAVAGPAKIELQDVVRVSPETISAVPVVVKGKAELVDRSNIVSHHSRPCRRPCDAHTPLDPGSERGQGHIRRPDDDDAAADAVRRVSAFVTRAPEQPAVRVEGRLVTDDYFYLDVAEAG